MMQNVRNFDNSKELLICFEKIGGIIIAILILLYFYRTTFYDLILDFRNDKSMRYKKMYDLLQLHLLNDKGEQTLKGEITLIREK